MPDNGVELLERYDGYAHLRNSLHNLSQKRGEWAGYPMPLEGEKLVIEPNYPCREAIASCEYPETPTLKPSDDLEEYCSKCRVRNTFWSSRHRCDIVIYSDPDDKIFWVKLHDTAHNFHRYIRVLGCQVAWGIEQEANAIHTLGGLLKHHQFKQYMLTGMFLESSKRSGLTYLFRKLRPTVVVDARDQTAYSTRILCTLCLHPIAYYEDTWAGAMTPTDDVIAHLQLMRGDEHMFWRRANQHPAYRLESGL